jgi:hypothetical protein
MKTLEEIIKQEPVYLGAFTDKHEVATAFENPGIHGVNLLFSVYAYKSYSGEAFVLFEAEGKLYEINGSHCSCYGLEGQWRNWEEVSLEGLAHRLTQGSEGYNRYRDLNWADELCEFIGIPKKNKR